ncbi:MAG: hypothetical protein WDW38_003217 [Sanguina aurantia]
MKTAMSDACNGRDVQAIAKAAAPGIGLATAAAYSATKSSQGGAPSKAVAAAVGAALLADLVSALSDTDGGKAPFCLPKPRLAQPVAPVGLNTTALPAPASSPQPAAQFSGGQPSVPSAATGSAAPSTEYLTPASPSAVPVSSPVLVTPASPARLTPPVYAKPASPGAVVESTQPTSKRSPAPSSPSPKPPAQTAAPTPPDTGLGANWNGLNLPQAFTFPPFPVIDFGPGGGDHPLTAWNPFELGK